MNIEISKRLELVTKSEIRTMSLECDKSNGINLSQGICDLSLPEPIIKGVDDAILSNKNHYTRHDGVDSLRQAIAHKANNYNRIDADPNKNIVVNSGATGALFAFALSVLNPGDEVIIFEPFYSYHVYTLQAVDAVPVFAKLGDDYRIDMDKLDSLVTKKTRAIIINTPSNPSGKIFTLKELEELGDFCIKHDLLIVTDEIYEYIVYDGKKHLSPGCVPSIKDRVVTISGYSKTFSITGWRIGYSISNQNIANLIGIATDLVYVCAPAPLQYGVANAIQKLDADFYTSLKNQYQKKRDKLCSVLTDLDLMPSIPEGAYYIMTDISRLPGSTSKEKTMWLLNKTGIAAVAGSAFYSKGGENFARFCFAKDNAIIDQACEKLQIIKKLI